MKQIFTLIILIISFLLVYTSSHAQKKNDIIIAKLETSAHSDQCKAKIEKTLAYEKGIISSELNRETQILTVKFKRGKTNVEKIIKVINSLGHDAKEIDESGKNDNSNR